MGYQYVMHTDYQYEQHNSHNQVRGTTLTNVIRQTSDGGEGGHWQGLDLRDGGGGDGGAHCAGGGFLLCSLLR